MQITDKLGQESGFLIRRASLNDSSDIASILRDTRRHDLPFLPVLHTPEEDLSYIQYIIMVQDKVVVAEIEDRVVGFCALRGEVLDHLYVLPKYQGLGVGSAFIEWAKGESERVELWVFQKNVRAQEFYVSKGFVKVEETDGSGNEEGVADARYMWKK